jgi:hypothetical protein
VPAGGQAGSIAHLNWNEVDGFGYDDLGVRVGDEMEHKGAFPMIGAVVQNGLIHPLDPLPLDWAEGRLGGVEDAASAASDDLDAWYDELRRLGPAHYDPGEREQIRAILAEADAQAKEIVRREMELS